ncbi:hypothetical protein SERLADRAFT_399775 [Serpula lacrymans var. lacrymans S7.9]|uniref:Uncharacterized protein n=1 Tax=Serpula lacrymans var. lacrymans (strain S7.9) TaxID=578457 RepID=F8P8C0_SERL9|nr:uncharacterized protein SERLADRAFT_399775 [Serpula lacrymans var. lacrymans S7.9]EGO20676.1 hypothetical protein SERLADRAFT_399775 [Serpula lacrymans var. lacrymans S7.9]
MRFAASMAIWPRRLWSSVTDMRSTAALALSWRRFVPRDWYTPPTLDGLVACLIHTAYGN